MTCRHQWHADCRAWGSGGGERCYLCGAERPFSAAALAASSARIAELRSQSPQRAAGELFRDDGATTPEGSEG